MDIFILIGLATLNGFFSLTEFAVISARRSLLEQDADRGDKGARYALDLSRSPTRFLSTIQIGITLVGILSGAVGEAKLAGDVREWLRGFPTLAPYSDTLGFVIVIAFVTFLSLILGELIPKRIGMSWPNPIAKALSRPLRVVAWIAAPIVAVLSLTTDLVLRPFGKRLAEEPDVNEAEVRDLIVRGAETGVFHHEEQQLVERVFNLGDQQVQELMVPRPDLEWVDVHATNDRIRDVVRLADQDHVPLCKGTIDQIVGIVRLRDLVHELVSGFEPNLGKLASSPVFVPAAMPAVRLLETLKRAGQQCAIVVDEFGGTRGMIELADLLHELLGELGGAGEAEDEPDIVPREGGGYLVSGRCPASALKKRLGLSTLPGEDRADFTTVAGLLLTNLGHLPKVGEVYAFDCYRMEVVDLDHRRIDKVLLTIVEREAEGEPDAET